MRRNDLLKSIKQSLSVNPDWEIKIAKVQISSFPFLYRAGLEFHHAGEVRLQNIFISTDSRRYIIGSVFATDVDMDEIRQKKLDIKRSPSKGNESAPVVLVEFSDLQCVSCKRIQEDMNKEKLLKTYKKKVLYVKKYLPHVKFHNWALPASVGCLCAWRQNKNAFWKMQEDIYSEQGNITPQNLREKLMNSAKRWGLNLQEFGACFDQKQTLKDVESDIAEAGSLGIRATPSFLVNGRLLRGPTVPQVKKVIDEFLAAN